MGRRESRLQKGTGSGTPQRAKSPIVSDGTYEAATGAGLETAIPGEHARSIGSTQLASKRSGWEPGRDPAILVQPRRGAFHLVQINGARTTAGGGARHL